MKVSIFVLLPVLLCTIGAAPVPADGDENRSTGVGGQLFNIFTDPLNIVGGLFGKTTTTTPKPYDYNYNKYPNKPQEYKPQEYKPQEYKPQQYKPQDYNNGYKPMMPNKYPANYNKPGPDYKPAKPYGGTYNKPSSYEYGNQEKPLNIYINIPAVPAVAKPTKSPKPCDKTGRSDDGQSYDCTTTPSPYIVAATYSTTTPAYQTTYPTIAAYQPPMVPPPMTAAPYQQPTMAPQPPMAAPYPLVPIAQPAPPTPRPQDYMYGPHI